MHIYIHTHTLILLLSKEKFGKMWTLIEEGKKEAKNICTVFKKDWIFKELLRLCLSNHPCVYNHEKMREIVAWCFQDSSHFNCPTLQISLHDIRVKLLHHVCRCEIEADENKVVEWGVKLGGTLPWHTWHTWRCGSEPQQYKTQTTPQRWGAREKKGERRARRTGRGGGRLEKGWVRPAFLSH